MKKINDSVPKGSFMGTKSDDAISISQGCAGDMDTSVRHSDPPSSPNSREVNEKMDGVSEGSIVGTESYDVINISLSSFPSLGEEAKIIDEMSKKDSVEGTPKSNDMDTPGDSKKREKGNAVSKYRFISAEGGRGR